MTTWTHIDEAKPPAGELVWVSDGVLVEFGEYNQRGLEGYGDIAHPVLWQPLSPPAPPEIDPIADDSEHEREIDATSGYNPRGHFDSL